MDAKQIMEIVKKYNAGEMSFADASLALILIGLTADNIKKLL